MFQEEGPGWRLARDPARNKFPVLVGGENWAIELTDEEWTSFVSVFFELIDQHTQFIDRLMPQEVITLEIERGHWWACLDGNQDSWEFQFVLQGDAISRRGVEGCWPFPAAQEMASAMRKMWDSCH